MQLLKSAEDVEYINLLKLPLFVVSEPGNLDKSVNKNFDNVHTPHQLNDSANHVNFNTTPSTSKLTRSILKRKASTPYQTANLYENDSAYVSASPHTLASSLNFSCSKSVKIKLDNYTRE